MEHKDTIIAALRKLGPAGPKAIAAKAGISKHLARTALELLSAEGEVKSTGNGRGLLFALKDQEFGAPAPKNQPAKRKKHGKKKSGGKAKRRRRAPEQPVRIAQEFHAAVDAKNCIVILVDGHAHRYTPEQSLAIAELAFMHFEP